VREEELVRGVIDLLAAEIPYVQSEAPTVLKREFVAVDFDTSCGVLFTRQGQIRAVQSPNQRSLPGTSLTEN
jgi:hypothetical protein